jgi:hypothetical protein
VKEQDDKYVKDKENGTYANEQETDLCELWG